MKKKITFGIMVIVLGLSGYYGFKATRGSATPTRYVLAAVEKGTLVASVAGSGQVSVSNQIDIKPKASGDIVYLGAMEGQEIKSGTLIAQIDAKDALKNIRDAELNLETANLSLEKFQQPVDDLTLLQAENSMLQAQDTLKKNQDDLSRAYDDGFNTIANAFLDLPNIMTGVHDILYGYSFGSSQQNIDYYADGVKNDNLQMLQYKQAASLLNQSVKTQYDINYSDYKTSSRFSDTGAIESLLTETYDTTKNIAESLKGSINFIQFYKDKVSETGSRPSSVADTHLASLNNYTGETNTNLNSLLSAKQNIENAKQNIINTSRSVAEKTESLAKLKAGPDPLDMRSQKLSLQQKQNSLADARQKLADYYVRAPFDGILIKVEVKKGDSVSASTVIATLITKQHIANISLNEVDVARIKLKQKATLTFDAVSGLSIAGEVIDIDSIGTISQGVVTYNVTIGFDTQDGRIKPGMSVSAAIITDAKQDVLLVPNSAVKSSNNESYVEKPLTNAGSTDISVQRQNVTTGLVNDTMTEIINGLDEGDQVVTQTITSAATQTATQNQQRQNQGIRIPGIGGGFGR